MNSLELPDLLHARAGIVCAVGAGGKKTLLHRLAALHPGPLALTATVLTSPLLPRLDMAPVVATAERAPP